MQYRGIDFKYDEESSEIGAVQELQANKQFKRKRLVRAKRRSTKKSPNVPSCGIGARRNNRWTW